MALTRHSSAKPPSPCCRMNHHILLDTLPLVGARCRGAAVPGRLRGLCGVSTAAAVQSRSAERAAAPVWPPVLGCTGWLGIRQLILILTAALRPCNLHQLHDLTGPHLPGAAGKPKTGKCFVMYSTEVVIASLAAAGKNCEAVRAVATGLLQCSDGACGGARVAQESLVACAEAALKVCCADCRRHTLTCTVRCTCTWGG